MSGKGSRPRPFSVDHSTFSSNWDKIFGATPGRVDQEVEALRRMRDSRTDGERQSEAWLTNEHYDQQPTLICPRATDHRLDCTNSNDPGQPGSRYQ